MITLQDILDNSGDYVGNYTTSTIDPGARIRAANRSIEYIKRRLGLPSDETIQTIDFCDDQFFYDLNTDLDEAYFFQYHDPLLNIPQRLWDYMPYEDLIQNTGNSRAGFRFSLVTFNGLKQLMVVGQNMFKGTLLASFDDVDAWQAYGDASNLSQDVVEKYKGDASLAFDITNSLGYAGIFDDTISWNLQSLFERHGHIKFWNWMSDDNITNVKLKLFVDASNYWTITATEQDGGTAFEDGEFTKLDFALDDAVETLSPEITDTITKVQIEYTLGPGFTTAINFRLDHMFTVIPDKMDLIYYTRYKGWDQSRTTNKINLTAASDIVRIGDYFDDYLDIISRRTALNLLPQLRGDKDFYQTYMADFNEMMKTMGKSFPRKRLQNNFMRHSLRR